MVEEERTLQCTQCNRTVEESEGENLDQIDCSEIFPSLDCDGYFQVMH